MHPLSPRTTRGRRLIATARAQFDPLAPPLPFDPHADPDEAIINAVTDPGGDTTPPNVIERFWGGFITLAEHLVGLANRSDHMLARLAAIQGALENDTHIDYPLVLGPAPQVASAMGKLHLWMWVPDKVAGLSDNLAIFVEVSGIKNQLYWNGTSPTTQNQGAGGWFQLDPPGGECRLTCPSATGAFAGDVSVWLRATNHPPQGTIPL